MKPKDKVDIEITINEKKIKLTGTFIAGDPGVHTFRNGDPGYPPTPTEFEIDSATTDNVLDIIEEVEQYYNDYKLKVEQKIVALIEDNELRILSDTKKKELIASIKRSFYLGETFQDMMSFKAADQIEENNTHDYSEEFNEEF